MTLLFVLQAVWAAGLQQRPNIVLVFADDMGWADFSCFGYPPIEKWGPGLVESKAAGRRNKTSVFAAIDLVPAAAIGEEHHTLVLFMSDNGACAEVDNQTPDIPPGPMKSYRTYDVPWANAGDTPFHKYRRWTHEGGICTPLIVKWTRVVEAAERLSSSEAGPTTCSSHWTTNVSRAAPDRL